MNYNRKILKLDFIKFRHISSSLYFVEKRPAIKWEEILKIHLTDKRLISRIYKELFKLDNKETASLKKWEKT